MQSLRTQSFVRASCRASAELRAEPPYAELRVELRAEPPYAELPAELRAELHAEPPYAELRVQSRKSRDFIFARPGFNS